MTWKDSASRRTPSPARRLRWAAACAACGLLATPEAAQAHGIVGKADLPIPVWLFSWAAAVVLVVSFVALSTLWTTPQLQVQRLRRAFSVPAVLPLLLNVIGIGFFALVVYSGFAGAQVANANFSVTFIYVAFWVGVPLASVLAGDIFRALSPWRSAARLLWWLFGRGRRARLSYPQAAGVWPAIAGLVGFAWLELIYAHRDVPSTLAALSAGYFAVMMLGAALFGVEEFLSKADGFGVYFNLLARLSAIDYRSGAAYLRRPLSGITDLPIVAGTVTLICTIIGTTTFDGVSNGGYWRELSPEVSSVFTAAGFHQTPSVEFAYTLGLLACIALVAGIYRLGVLGMRSISDLYTSTELTRSFAAHPGPDRLRVCAGALLLAPGLAGTGARLPDLRSARERRQPDRHQRLADQLPRHLLCGHLVRAGGGAASRPCRRPDAGARPGTGHLP